MFISCFYKLFSCLCRALGITYSFSLDGEDSILLKYLIGIKNGFYLDVGSHKPVKSSNTFLFYTLGWKGICIDPLPTLKKPYSLTRSRDLFINAGIVSSELKVQPKLDFYFYKKYPDNSTFDPVRVEQLKKLFSRFPTKKISVPLITVENMLTAGSQKFGKICDFHLLNLDTEGFEKSILKDFFSLKIYPWIICVEDLGKTVSDLDTSDLHNLMTEEDYILGAKTFLTSIYVRKEKLSEFPSPFVRELIT